MTTITIDLSDVRRAGSVESAIEAACEHSEILLATSAAMGGQTFATSGPGSGWCKHYDSCDYAVAAIRDDIAQSGCRPSDSKAIDPGDGRIASGVDPAEGEDCFLKQEASSESWIVSAVEDGAMDGQTVWLLKLADGNFVSAWPDDAASWEEDNLDNWLCKRQTTPAEHNAIVTLWAERREAPASEWHGTIEWSKESCVEVAVPSVEEAIDEPELVAMMLQSVIDYHHAESDAADWHKLVEKIRRAAEALADVDLDDLPE